MSRGWLAVLVGALLSGCGDRASAPGIRPGDSVFDVITGATLSSFPETNLPESMVDHMRRPFVLQSRELHVDQWSSAGPLPARLGSAIGDTAIRFWSAVPGIRPRQENREVAVYVEGLLHRRWNRDSEPFPGWDVWWDDEAGNLFALSATPPERVSASVMVDPQVELSAYEPMLFGDGSSMPRPGDLMRSVQLGMVSRRALFMPAPSILVVPLGMVECEQLRLSVGLMDHSYHRDAGRCIQAEGGSDGVMFAVDISVAGRWKRLWRREIVGTQAGAWSPEETIDLRGHRGKRVSLRLVVEPGAAGNRDFDYAVWGGLRFYGNVIRPPDRPHIVLIDFDTLRKDRFGCYGGTRGLTPNLDEWASRSTVFTDCVSAAPWTLPSTASMLTGYAVHQHGVDRYPEALSEDLSPLPMLLSGAGYETVGIAEGGYVSGDFGFDVGFDFYDCTRFKDPGWPDVLQWLRSRRSERPLFLFLHTYMTHAPFPYDPRFEDPQRPYPSALRGKTIDYSTVFSAPPDDPGGVDPEDRRYVTDLYDAQVCRLDTLVAAFLDSLDDAVDHQPCVVVLTADHGEELLEHGLVGHGQSLCRELLDVPLIIRFPESARTRASDPRPVSALDLVPTLLDIAGLPPRPGLPGSSLMTDLGSERVRIASQSEQVHALIADSLKFISGRVRSPRGLSVKTQLYDLRSDPGESINLTATERSTVTRLSQQLAMVLKKHRPPTTSEPLSSTRDGQLRRLEALGYVRHDQPSAPSPSSPVASNPSDSQ